MNKSRHVHGGLSLRRKGCFLKVFTEVASGKMFSKICSEVGLLRRRQKLCEKAQSWVPFEVITFYKLKAFSVFKRTLHATRCDLDQLLPVARHLVIHPDWPVLNWQPMRAWVPAERIKTSRVWQLIRNIATFNRANVTATIPSLHNFLIPGRKPYRYHAVHCCCRWSDLLLKIIDCGRKREEKKSINR